MRHANLRRMLEWWLLIKLPFITLLAATILIIGGVLGFVVGIVVDVLLFFIPLDAVAAVAAILMMVIWGIALLAAFIVSIGLLIMWEDGGYRSIKDVFREIFSES